MKKLLTALFILVNLSAFGQASDWFVSLSSGYSIGGPLKSIKNQMVEQGYSDTHSYDFFGITGSTKYPRTAKGAYLLVRGGKKITGRRSIYFIAGQVDQGEVWGFKANPNPDPYGFIIGDFPDVRFSLLQFSAGYQFHYANTRAKLGLGPTIFILKQSSYGHKLASYAPGLTATARLPLGKEKRLVGMELIMDANLGLPMKMKQTFTSSFSPGKVNLCSLNLGLAISFRRTIHPSPPPSSASL
jgi:hypothetical protein